jgi:predicted unusual protein kinase regulating ubiquinone biosynthesis (AarF/ABC1/UbiB family)
VAVKVHHAGIAEAVESDLRNIAMLEGVVGPLGARKPRLRERGRGALRALP